MFYTDYSQLFLELYEDLELIIGGLKTKYPIVVVEHGDHELISKNPFSIL